MRSWYERRTDAEVLVETQLGSQRSRVRAPCAARSSHKEERLSDIWRPHGDPVDSLGRHDGRNVVAVLCDGGFTNTPICASLPAPHGHNHDNTQD